MRISASKPKSSRQPDSAKAQDTGVVYRGLGHEGISRFHLHRAIGNQGMQRLSLAPVQTKRQRESADSTFEREADLVADQVVSARSREPMPRISSAAGEVKGEVAPILSSGQPLVSSLRSEFGQRLGFDFGNVRFHTSSVAATAAEAVGAKAYTYGTDVVFGRGAYEPSTDRGRHLIAHELTHVVQQQGGAPQVQCYDGPRLAETTVRRDPLNRHVLVFSDAVTRDRAISLVWQGEFRPALEVFHPDHADPWADRDAGRYQRFIFDYGNPVGRTNWHAMWDRMRSPVRSLYGRGFEEAPDVTRDPQEDRLFPDWVPEVARRAVLTGDGLTRRGRTVQVGIVPSRRGAQWPLLIWRRASPQGDINYALEGLWSEDLSYYQSLNVSDGTARLMHRALRGWNADMTRLVFGQGMHPRRARQIVRQENRVKMVIGLLELYSYMIPARFGAAPRVRAMTDVDATLARQGRRIAREMRRMEVELAESAVPAECASTLPPEHAPTLPADRAPTIPAERAPTIPAERAPTIPAERAPTIPAERAPTIPGERAPTIPAERAPTIPDVPTPHRPAIPPPPPEPMPPIPEIPGPPRVPREFRPPVPEGPPSPSPSQIPHSAPTGTQLTSMTSEQSQVMWRHHGDMPMDMFFGEGVGAQHYRLRWEQLGGTGPPPPFGFVVRDAAGHVLQIVYRWTSSHLPPRI